MQLEMIAVERINPAPYNPRKDLQPGDSEYEKLKRSMEEFDCVEPLVWNRRTGNLVGGHQRLKILLARGDREVACSVVDLPSEREKALNLALNKISGDWDREKLASLLDELTQIPEFDVELTGFELPEVSKLLDEFLVSGGEGDDGFDVEAELEAIDEPETKPGELIELGPHRVLCGDSTRHEDVARLMGERQAGLVFTDPPYAVDYRGGRVGKEWSHKIRRDGERYWDEMDSGSYKALLESSLAYASEFSDEKAPLYLWFASARISEVIEVLRRTGWQQRNLIVWVKNTFAGSLYAQYKHRYEPVFYCHKKGKAPRWFGPTNETTVWEHKKPSKNEGHPTIKPLALAERAVRNSSARGEVVLDLFLGSGTTLVAAERMGRVCYGMEKEPRYCDLVRKRYRMTAAVEVTS